jgi:hypothetical protein
VEETFTPSRGLVPALATVSPGALSAIKVGVIGAAISTAATYCLAGYSIYSFAKGRPSRGLWVLGGAALAFYLGGAMAKSAVATANAAGVKP